MKKQLGDLETQFFAYVQMRKLRTVRSGDLTSSLLRLTPDQERKLLSRLSRGGLIARVRQDLYLAPPQLPLGGAWIPNQKEYYINRKTPIKIKARQKNFCPVSANDGERFTDQGKDGDDEEGKATAFIRICLALEKDA
jgi:hypothetical protein